MAAGAHVEAEFQDRKRIVFTARERASVNVRIEGGDGGPIGYNSFELLCIALANCTLGVVMGHDSLKDEKVRGCRATLDADTVSGPTRVERIAVSVELDVEGGDARLQQTLQRVADACPVGNTLRMPTEIAVRLTVMDSRGVAEVRAGQQAAATRE